MQAIEVISDLRSAINNAKKNGVSEIPVIRLETYLNEIEKIITQNNQHAEQNRLIAQKNFENQMEIWKVQSIHAIEMFKSVIEAGLNALKAAIIINGGAAASLLAFLGTKTITNTTPIHFSKLGCALLIFLIGTGCAGTASGVRYLSQASYGYAMNDQFTKNPNSNWKCAGNFFNILAITLGAASFALFFYGGWRAYVIFTAHS